MGVQCACTHSHAMLPRRSLEKPPRRRFGINCEISLLRSRPTKTATGKPPPRASTSTRRGRTLNRCRWRRENGQPNNPAITRVFSPPTLGFISCSQWHVSVRISDMRRSSALTGWPSRCAVFMSCSNRSSDWSVLNPLSCLHGLMVSFDYAGSYMHVIRRFFIFNKVVNGDHR
jgi:hypothetical protein